MGSKFIPSKGKTKKKEPLTWLSFIGDVDNKPSKEEKEYNKKMELKKKELRNIPVEGITFRDVYTLPLRLNEYSGWVYDSEGHFLFQFDGEVDEERIVNILNGIAEDKGIRNNLKYDDGEIYVESEGNWELLITIRGWGGLTGIGGYDLDEERAVRIQDTLGQWIIKTLNK